MAAPDDAPAPVGEPEPSAKTPRWRRRIKRLATRLGASAGFRFAFFSALAATFAWPVLMAAPQLNEFRDFHILGLYQHSAVDAVTRFGQLPLWDPYFCGGQYSLGNPQTRWASPLFLLSLLFGPFRGDGVAIFAMTLIGQEGMFRWLRDHTGGRWGPLLVAPMFPMHGWFAALHFLGWHHFFSFAFVPWALLGVRRCAQGHSIGVFLVAASLALMLASGGHYPIPMTALFAVFEVMWIWGPKVRRPQTLRLPLTISILALIVSAELALFRLWPVLETLAAAPRIMLGTPGVGLPALGAMVIDPMVPVNGDLPPKIFYLPVVAAVLVAVGVWGRRSLFAILMISLSVWGRARVRRRTLALRLDSKAPAAGDDTVPGTLPAVCDLECKHSGKPGREATHSLATAPRWPVCVGGLHRGVWTTRAESLARR